MACSQPKAKFVYVKHRFAKKYSTENLSLYLRVCISFCGFHDQISGSRYFFSHSFGRERRRFAYASGKMTLPRRENQRRADYFV